MSLFKKLLQKKEKLEDDKLGKEEMTENNNKVSNEAENHFMEALQGQVNKPENKKVKVETQIRPGDGMGFNSKITS